MENKKLIDLFSKINIAAEQKALQDLGIDREIVDVGDYSDDEEAIAQSKAYRTLFAFYQQELLEKYKPIKNEANQSKMKSKILKFYLIAIVIISLIVPYQQTLSNKGVEITKFHGYELVFDSPKPIGAYYSPEISFQRLGLEFVAISAIAGVVYITSCNNK